MSPRGYVAMCVLLVIVAVAVWWCIPGAPKLSRHSVVGPASPPLVSTSQPSSPGNSPVLNGSSGLRQVDARTVIGRVESSLHTPISFYGKVIDQNGEPVASANVRFGVIDQFDAEGSHYEAKSNDQGEFTISGIHGAVLTVGTWKDGFYN